MRKRAFLINSLMLTSAVLLSRVIGISFRVYMSNKIGAEGIGLYQLICTIFLFASTFVTSGVRQDHAPSARGGNFFSVMSFTFHISLRTLFYSFPRDI